MNYNSVTLIGRTTKPAETKTFENGGSITKLSLAVDDPYMDKNTNEWINNTSFFDVVTRGKLAERLVDFPKGKLVVVGGKLNQRKWQDSENNNRYSIEVVANTLRLLEKREGNSNNFSNAVDEPKTNKQAAKKEPQAVDDSDSLPF